MTQQLIILICALLPIVFLLVVNRVLFREFFLDLRLGRILHYFAVFLFGFSLHTNDLSDIKQVSSETWLEMANFFLALTYAAVFAIATNNEEDLEIDKISNKSRPLVKESVPLTTYRMISRLSLIVSILLSAVIGIHYFLTILGLSLVYYIYSCKPFKLKRFVFLAKLLIGVNTLISAYCGFLTANGKVNEFPLFWIVFILIPISLMANFVDLKDLEGDRHAGIKTIPVLWGNKVAKNLLAIFTISAYSMVFVYFQTNWISCLLVLLCAVHVLLLFRKPYNEKPLFLLHNSLFLGLISLIILKNNW